MGRGGGGAAGRSRTGARRRVLLPEPDRPRGRAALLGAPARLPVRPGALRDRRGAGAAAVRARAATGDDDRADGRRRVPGRRRHRVRAPARGRQRGPAAPGPRARRGRRRRVGRRGLREAAAQRQPLLRAARGHRRGDGGGDDPRGRRGAGVRPPAGPQARCGRGAVGARRPRRLGLGGIEVDHPNHAPADRELLRGITAEHGLLTTGSSDYHGTNKTTPLAEETTDPEYRGAHGPDHRSRHRDPGRSARPGPARPRLRCDRAAPGHPGPARHLGRLPAPLPDAARRPPAPPRGGGFAHTTIGAVVHLALRSLAALPAERRTPEQAASLVDRHWTGEGFADDAQAARYRERARDWLAAAVDGPAGRDEPLAVERWVRAPAGPLLVEGRVDRIDARDGEAVVVDFKTGRRVPTAADAADSRQLALYAVATASVFRRPCRRVELHHVPTGTVAAHTHDQASLDRHVAAAAESADAAAGATTALADGGDADTLFPARTGAHCGTCAVRRNCAPGRAAVRSRDRGTCSHRDRRPAVPRSAAPRPPPAPAPRAGPARPVPRRAVARTPAPRPRRLRPPPAGPAVRPARAARRRRAPGRPAPHRGPARVPPRAAPRRRRVPPRAVLRRGRAVARRRAPRRPRARPAVRPPPRRGGRASGTAPHPRTRRRRRRGPAAARPGRVLAGGLVVLALGLVVVEWAAGNSGVPGPGSGAIVAHVGAAAVAVVGQVVADRRRDRTGLLAALGVVVTASLHDELVAAQLDQQGALGGEQDRRGDRAAVHRQGPGDDTRGRVDVGDPAGDGHEQPVAVAGPGAQRAGQAPARLEAAGVQRDGRPTGPPVAVPVVGAGAGDAVGGGGDRRARVDRELADAAPGPVVEGQAGCARQQDGDALGRRGDHLGTVGTGDRRRVERGPVTLGPAGAQHRQPLGRLAGAALQDRGAVLGGGEGAERAPRPRLRAGLLQRAHRPVLGGADQVGAEARSSTRRCGRARVRGRRRTGGAQRQVTGVAPALGAGAGVVPGDPRPRGDDDAVADRQRHRGVRAGRPPQLGEPGRDRADRRRRDGRGRGRHGLGVRGRALHGVQRGDPGQQQHEHRGDQSVAAVSSFGGDARQREPVPQGAAAQHAWCQLAAASADSPPPGPRPDPPRRRRRRGLAAPPSADAPASGPFCGAPSAEPAEAAPSAGAEAPASTATPPRVRERDRLRRGRRPPSSPSPSRLPSRPPPSRPAPSRRLPRGLRAPWWSPSESMYSASSPARRQVVGDHLPAGDLVPVHQRDRDALAPGAAGAADPVHVGLGVLGALVVDDVRDAGDVDAAGRDVGRDQHVDLLRAERAQRLLTGALAQVAVHGGGGEAALGEVVGDPLGGPLGAGEDHRQAAVLGLQDAGDQLDLVHRVRAVDQLRGALVDGALVGLLRADVRRAVQEGPRERHDRARHGGREQHRVPLLGEHAQDPLDVGQEAQVQHLVGLVEDERLDPAEHQVALLGEVEQPARGADDDVDALAQGLELRLVGAAAVDGDDAHAEVLARGGDVPRDLHAQLAGRDDDERLRDVLGAVRGLALGGGGGALTGRGEALQQRDAEAQRLAGAGAGLADDVLAGQGQRERQLLDRERADDVVLGERGDDLGTDAELGERRGELLAAGVGHAERGLAGGDAGGQEARVGLGGVGAVDSGQGDRLSPRTGAVAWLVDRPRAVGDGPGGRAAEALRAPVRVRVPVRRARPCRPLVPLPGPRAVGASAWSSMSPKSGDALPAWYPPRRANTTARASPGVVSSLAPWPGWPSRAARRARTARLG
ncbi:hypothetical protein L7F22_015023 [Adiantum nelumboides]|nr:hypothetical protein [Adiantum nelumboides]